MFKLFRALTALLIMIIANFNGEALDQPLEEKRDVLTRAFSAAFNIPLPNCFQPLIGGFSSPGIYKFIVSEKPYVLRLSHPKRKLPDEQRTMSCITLSAERQLSPRVYYASAEDGLVIMDYIEPKLLSWEELTEPRNLKELALTITKLHAGPEFPYSVTVFDVRRSFEQMLGDDKPNFLDELTGTLNKIEASLKDGKIEDLPCHHDLKLDNILFDGKQFWMVDWEAACQGNYLFDIATVITFMAMTGDQEDFFLETYFGKKPTDTQRTQLDLMKQVVLSYYGTAYLMVAKIRYQQPPVTGDLSTLPNAQPFIRSHIKNSSSSISPQNIQEFGLVLLNQALKTIIGVSTSKSGTSYICDIIPY